jgi:hypothetical protein
MMDRRKNVTEEIRESLKQYEICHNQRASLRRLKILQDDPSAPICIICKYCIQSGFLFHCPIFELEEDGDVVGEWGNVYYLRKGKKRTYERVPMKPKDCPMYLPIIPFKVR